MPKGTQRWPIRTSGGQRSIERSAVKAATINAAPKAKKVIVRLLMEGL